MIAALTLVLIASDAFGYGLFIGQLGLLAALALVAALDQQGRGRPIGAGIWLGVATIKVSTMLPFLLLFLRKSDLRTWVALVLTCSTLCLLGGFPSLLPGASRGPSSRSRLSAHRVRSTTIRSRGPRTRP